ncbi:MAG: hypothetical protein IT306_28825 [Chloroflexi bacterium]|nr:hypothetical protein [Chloroflexota bacterium]
MRRRQQHRQVASRRVQHAALPVCAAVLLVGLSLGLAGLSLGLVGLSLSSGQWAGARVPADALAHERPGAPVFWSVASWPPASPPLALTGPQRVLIGASVSESRQRIGLSLTPGIPAMTSALVAGVATVLPFRWLPPLSPAHGQLAVRAPPSSAPSASPQ